MKSLLLAATLASASCFASAESSEVVDLASRPQVIQRTLVERPAGQPTGATLVLLMGANGQLGIFPNGSLRRDSHFLARVRGLFARGPAVVLVDAPSDRGDLDGDFRETKNHAADPGAVIAYARKAFGQPVWLVGHSRGTHSAVTAAMRLAGDAAPRSSCLPRRCWTAVGSHPRQRSHCRNPACELAHPGSRAAPQAGRLPGVAAGETVGIAGEAAG